MNTNTLSTVPFDLARFFSIKWNLNHQMRITGHGMCVTPEPIVGTNTTYKISYIVETYSEYKELIEIGYYDTNTEVVAFYSDEYLKEFLDEVEYIESLKE